MPKTRYFSALALALILPTLLVTTPARALDQPFTFALSSPAGPVHYGCESAITYSLDPAGITASGSTLQREMQMWSEVFASVESHTAYRFTRLGVNDDAHIKITYESDFTTVLARSHVPGEHVAGLGGITEYLWSGNAWIAQHSTIALNSADLRKWNKIPGLRSWVARHELGHALGLAHVSDPTQIMTSHYNPLFPESAYRSGDIAGLQALSLASC